MTVVHILKDGTRLDDITGHVIKLEDAVPLYQFLTNLKLKKTDKSRIHTSNKILGEN